MILIDADIEAERPGKLADPSLGNPVLLFELLSLQRLVIVVLASLFVAYSPSTVVSPPHHPQC
jgi:hypothetical protein